MANYVYITPEQARITHAKTIEYVVEQNTPADIAISELFNKTEIIECSNDIVNKAKSRYDLGNPPGKKIVMEML